MKRHYELPAIQDLSKEQELARALPKNGRHLVVGGPGTGKSVVALLRARRHEKDREPYIFLVYNRLLHEASCSLGGNEIHCRQWQQWFFHIFKSELKQNVPRLPTMGGSTWQPIDWDGVNHILTQHHTPCPQGKPFLIIDEGQDMPPAFYTALLYLGFENFFVVADQNQQIVSGENSSRRDLEQRLLIDSDQVVELTKNYRNNRATALLAQSFYTGDPASPRPELPKAPSRQKEKPLLFSYKPDQFNLMIARILKLADREPTTLTGVICPNNRIRMHYIDRLNETANGLIQNGELDHPPSIRTFFTGCRTPVDFCKGGIIVINAQACKGLEFDHVFLVDIHDYFVHPNDPDGIKRLFYVMTARSKENVIMLKSAKTPCPVANIIPQDPDILTPYP